jgi:hypothetical protein
LMPIGRLPTLRHHPRKSGKRRTRRSGAPEKKNRFRLSPVLLPGLR